MNQEPEKPTRVPGIESSSPSLVHLWRAVRKNWSIALGTAAAIALSVTFYTLGQKKIYQTSATIEFDPSPPKPLGRDFESVVDLGAGNFWNNREYFETQYVVLQSRRLALAVVHALDLAHDSAFVVNAPEGTAPSPPAKLTEEEAADILRGRMAVDPVRESRLAVVTLDDANPERARKLLGAIIDTFIDQNLTDAVSSTDSAVDWLRTQLDKLKTDLEGSEISLHEFKKSKNILSVDMDAQSNMLREEMKQLNSALTEIRAKHEQVAARRGELLKVASDEPTNLPANELLQSLLLQSLRGRYEDAVRERDALLGSGKGPSHPEVQSAEARVAATRAGLLSEVRNIQGAVARELTTIVREEAGLAALFETSKRQALDLNLMEIEYNRLRRTKDNTEKLYSLVLERTKESDLSRMMRVNNIHVIDRPTLPRGSIKPKVPQNIVVGILLGLAAGVAAAMGRELLDRSVKTPADLEALLGIACLGLVPKIDDSNNAANRYARKRPRRVISASAKRELIVHEHPSSAIAEASRGIRTNLMFMSPDHPYRTLLVTSAGPAEGKTTIACCIAIAMAQAGQKVVLVDCDLRRPRMHRIFTKAPDLGVTSIILGNNEIHKEAFTTTIPNLSVIPSGPIPPNPAELMHSTRFKEFVDKLAQEYDRVVLDSPPLVAVTDAAILSTLTDGTALVVHAFKTTKELMRQALKVLRDVGGVTAGAILNQVDFDRIEYKTHYYYYKRDGYYASSPQIASMPTERRVEDPVGRASS